MAKDGHQWPFHPQGDPLPGQRQADTDLLVGQADQAGPPPAPVPATIPGHSGAHAQARLQGIIGRLLAARRGERNRLLFWASLRAGELVADGDLDAGTTAQALTGAATQIGLVSGDGPQAVAATIRSGFHRAGTMSAPAMGASG